MSEIAKTIEQIQSVNAEIGTKEFSRISGVPYTTLIDMAKKGFRPKAISTLEKLERSAAQKRQPDHAA